MLTQWRAEVGISGRRREPQEGDERDTTRWLK